MSWPQNPAPLDALLKGIRALIRQEFPTFTYLGLFEYTVQGVNSSDSSLDLDPIDTTIPLPVLANVPLKPSLMAEGALATKGTTALVEFVNADPARPVVVSIGATIFNGTIDASSTVNVGSSASTVNLGVAQSPISRISDTCIIYAPVGTTFAIVGVTVTPPGALVATVMPVTDPITNTPVPLQGIIGFGSSKTFAGGTGVARVGDGVTLFFSAGMYVTGTFTPTSGTPVPITAISISNGFGAQIATGSPNVVTA